MPRTVGSVVLSDSSYPSPASMNGTEINPAATVAISPASTRIPRMRQNRWRTRAKDRSSAARIGFCSRTIATGANVSTVNK